MIWHFIEVWVLVLGAFVIGCTAGAVLHDLVAQSSYATAQVVLANSVGDAVDRLKDRFGLAPEWRPRNRRIVARRAPEPNHVEPDRDKAGRGEASAGRQEPVGELVLAPENDEAGYEALEPVAEAGRHEEAEPQAEHEQAAELPEEPPAAASEPAEPTQVADERVPSVESPPAQVPADGIYPMRPATLTEPRNGVPDNLQRIRGIGERNEARLNGLGIFHFGQIAAWTPAEVRWIAQHLAFPERIERDDWTGQAIVLASGGNTGFTKSAERRRARRQQKFQTGADADDDADDASDES